MKKFNKMLSVLLSLVLCAGMVVPALAAASFEDLQDAINGSGDTNPIGDTGYYGYGANQENEAGQGWDIWAKDDDGTRDVQLKGDVAVAEPEPEPETDEDSPAAEPEAKPATGVVIDGGKKVVIGLNGNDITGDGKHNVISVNWGSSLNVNGGEAEGRNTIKGNVTNDGTLVVDKATVEGYVLNRGTLTAQNYAKVDGDVLNSGTFDLKEHSVVINNVYNTAGANYQKDDTSEVKGSDEGTLYTYSWNGGTYTLETVGDRNKVTVYPDYYGGVSGAKDVLGNLSNVELVIADGVTSIGEYAFFGCSGLTSVTIPDSMTSIGNGAFWGCSGLTSVTIGDGVTSIGDLAFYGCTGLTSVTIPDSVTSIGYSAFYECTGLTSVTIGSSVETIGECAFAFCDRLRITVKADNRNFKIEDGVLFTYDGTTLVCYPCGVALDTPYEIPDGVTSIGNYAFSGCSGLTSVTIPDSVTKIGFAAFILCSGLESVTIPDSVTSIEKNAFQDCSGLKSVTIPDSVTSIGDYAFYGCTGLESVTIGNGVTSIEYGAFYHCSGLTEVTIPDSVTSIGDYAFFWCQNLTSVEMPAGVTIASDTFRWCYYLSCVLIIGADDEQKADNKGLGCNVYVFSEDPNDNTVTFLRGDKQVTLTLDDVEAFKESINRTDGSVTFDVKEGVNVEGETLSQCDKTVTIAKNGNITKEIEHTPVSDEGKAATCTQAGYTAGTKCSVCGTTLSGMTAIPAKGHDMKDVEGTGVPATCTTDGKYADKACSRCDYTEEGDVITQLGHDMSVDIPENPAICTADGNEAGKQCSRCDHTEGAEVIEAKGHDMKEVADSSVAPTCTTAGKEADMACSRCDYKVTGAELPATKHNPGEPAQENVVEARPGVPGSYDLVTRCTKCTEILDSEHVVTSVDVTLDVSGGGTTHVGETIDLTVETNVDPEDDPVVWESSDPTIATVDENGKVTGVSEGTVTITATVGGVTVEMEITVTAVPVAPSTRPSVTVSFDYVGGTTRIEDEEVPLAGLISRADVIGYLWQKAGSPEAELSDFADVPEDHEWAVAIGWAQQSGIAVADEDGNFRPDDLLLRSVESLEISPEGELQEFLNRYAVYAGIELDEGELFIELAGSWDDAIMGEEAQEILNDFFARLEEALADIAA